MLDIVFWILIGLCLIFGLLGCFINKFPGPLLVLVGVLIARFGLNIEIPGLTIAVIAVMWIVSIILNKMVIPLLMKKIQEFSKAGSWGCTIGCLVGLPLMAVPENGVGLTYMAILTFVILPFAFSFIFEMVKAKNAAVALKSASSAYSVYLASSIIKLITFVYAVWAIFKLDNL